MLVLFVLLKLLLKIQLHDRQTTAQLLRDYSTMLKGYFLLYFSNIPTLSFIVFN